MPGSRFLQRLPRASGWAALALACVSSWSWSAWAKQVSLEWKPVKGATVYELEISKGERAVLKEKGARASWSGNLEPGTYVYQVRAYDRVGRAGDATGWKPLIIMSPPPSAIGPEDGQRIALYGPAAGALFRWKPDPGVSKYRLALKKDNAPYLSQITRESRLVIRSLPAGDYQWSVAPVLEGSGPLAGREWEGKAGDWRSLRVAHDRLKAPAPLRPLGAMLPSSDGTLRFEWKEVEGAQAYELELFRRDAIQGRVPASGAEPFARVRVRDGSAELKAPGEGGYVWRVRAVAHVDEGTAAWGPRSSAEFKLDRNAAYAEGAGFVAISTALAPYDYQVTSPSLGVKGSTSSNALVLRGMGEYWFHPHWGVGAGAEHGVFQLGGERYARLGLEASARYRILFGSPRSGWLLSPRVGFESRDYVEVPPANLGLNPIRSRVYGAQLGIDLRKQLSDRFSVGLRIAYFKPLALSSDRAGSLTGDASNRNLCIGAQALYWFGARWGASVGALFDQRSISYTLKESSTGSQAEQVRMDGVSFHGGLLYSFGR